MGDRWQTVQPLSLLVEIGRAGRVYGQAAALGAEAVALAVEIGQYPGAAWMHRDLGHVTLGRSDVDGAMAHFTASYGLFRERGYRLGVACVLVGLAVLSIRNGDGTDAALRLGGSRHLLEETSTALAPTDREAADGVVAVAREILGDAAYDAAFAEGRSLSIDYPKFVLHRSLGPTRNVGGHKVGPAGYPLP